MNSAWHLALGGAGKGSEKFRGSEMTGVPLASEEQLGAARVKERGGWGWGLVMVAGFKSAEKLSSTTQT